MKLESFKLERYFAKHEFSAPYLLCSSDCESMKVDELREVVKAERQRWRELIHQKFSMEK